jgi:hypothetical protein
MSALLGVIIRTALGLLAGVGVGAVMDKVAADKLPAYPAGGLGFGKDEAGGLHIPKIIYIVIAGVLAAVVLKFIGKKLNITILK